MRIAIVSDIHGNGMAFEAVLADLRQTSPDLVLHGGDLADCGSSPVEIVDTIRSLGWQGVAGNTDQMLASPETFEEFARQSPQLGTLWNALREMASATREQLGEDRLTWLRSLPLAQTSPVFALVHARPGDPWRAPAHNASDAELISVYGDLSQTTVFYGHIHRPYVRRLPGITVANTGSVGMPHDGDRRACYLLLDGKQMEHRRVEYDVDRELAALYASGMPHADWLARTLLHATPQMP
jgi:putative phosphoesterase